MTKEKYKQIHDKVANGITLSELIKDFDINEKFYVGCTSSYIFAGNVIDLLRDSYVIDMYYKEVYSYNKYNYNTKSILDEKVKKVYVKSEYEPKPVLAIIIEGHRFGKVWFFDEYPAAMKEIRDRCKRIITGNKNNDN